VDKNTTKLPSTKYLKHKLKNGLFYFKKYKSQENYDNHDEKQVCVGKIDRNENRIRGYPKSYSNKKSRSLLWHTMN